MALHGAQAPLPKSVRDLLRIASNTHPGLQLDKYAETWSESAAIGKLSGDVQRHVVDSVVRLSLAPADGLDFPSLLARRHQLWNALGARIIEAETVGPFTLHLARASALENAGICLHPIYGCLHLPGTGIKGMSRAYAETVWWPEQADQDRARRDIQQVFGHADDGEVEQSGNSGGIIFHDGWPTVWPKLQADILNSHHSQYYGGSDLRTPPPGDWEEPIPVVFLAASPGTRFQFAISPRRYRQTTEADTVDRLIVLAGEWLTGALEHLGAGAKTAAGYGTFRVISTTPKRDGTPVAKTTAPSTRCRSGAQYELELVTPAFLAGPHQPSDGALYTPAECDLRPATLRGMLRWWWRTMYAGWIRPTDLRRLENAIWGSTDQAGAVRVVVEPQSAASDPVLFDRRMIADANRLPNPPNNKTTQGLTYHTYGMDEDRGRRYFRPPGAKWRIVITGRSTKMNGCENPFNADEMLNQARMALWLLCEFGGVGAKSRKGFGALAMPSDLPVVDITELAKGPPQFLSRTGITLQSIPDTDVSASWKHVLQVADVETPWTNYWLALDRVGNAAQQFAQSKKHQLEKKALGLPRNVGRPVSGTFQAGPTANRTNRHASPIHYHLTRDATGCYRVRIIAFPSPQLPNLADSRQFLHNAIASIRTNVEGEIESHRTAGIVAAVLPKITPAPVIQAPAHPMPGERVAAKLLAEKTGKGGWKAIHEPSKLAGPIQNSTDVPTDKQPGDILDLIVAIGSPTQIAFRYPTAADEARAAKPPKPPVKGPKRR